MARLSLTSGFTVIPEGTYVLYIYGVEYDPDFGKMIVKFVTADGLKHQERFSLKLEDDTVNERAMNAFSFLAKTALNDFSLTEIDHTDLIGHYIRAEIVHSTQPNRKDPSKQMVFANIGNKTPADGFDTQPCEATLALMKGSQKSSAAPASAPSYDLDSLLG